MTKQAELIKGGITVNLEERKADPKLLRKARAYHRPTKEDLFDIIEENLKEYGEVDETAEDYVGLRRSDFVNLFMLLDDETPMEFRYVEAMARYQEEVSELYAYERVALMAELQEAWNDRVGNTCFGGETWA